MTLRAFCVLSFFVIGTMGLTACSGADESSPAELGAADNFLLGKPKNEPCSYDLQCAKELVCRPTERQVYEATGHASTCQDLAEIGGSCYELRHCRLDTTRSSMRPTCQPAQDSFVLRCTL